MCQLTETVARNIAEVAFDSTSATFYEIISRGDTCTPMAIIACNSLSNVAPCIRALILTLDAQNM